MNEETENTTSEEKDEFEGMSDEEIIVQQFSAISERLDTMDDRIIAQDKAVANTLRAIAGLVLDMVIYSDVAAAEDKRKDALGRIQRFTSVLSSRLQ